MAYIKGFGFAVPDRVVTNAELGAKLGRTPDWIKGVSGIEERRYLANGDSLTGLGTAAARDCLSRSGMKAEDVKLMVVSSGTATRRFPGPACSIAQQLGLGETPAIDLPVASAGSLFGMAVADCLANVHGPVLVVGAEAMSRVAMTEPLDPSVSILFGDGAGACLIHPHEGRARIVGSVLGTDGSFSEDLRLEFGAPLSMNGRAVILQASRKIPRAISQLLQKYGISSGAVDTFLMHQANQNLMDRVADALKVERARFFSNIMRYGNTSSGSLLIAAAEWSRQFDLGVGRHVCFAAFGAGFHWGALLAVGV